MPANLHPTTTLVEKKIAKIFFYEHRIIILTNVCGRKQIIFLKIDFKYHGKQKVEKYFLEIISLLTLSGFLN